MNLQHGFVGESQPEGLSCLPNYLSPQAADSMVSEIDSGEWRDDLKRRVQHFGCRYDYRVRRVLRADYLGPLPVWLDDLAVRLVVDGVFRSRPDQVIVNEYQPGQGIAAHVDCEPCFGEVIASLSLLSPCQMDFRRVGTEERRSTILEPNSLLVLSGPARWNWTHGIAARKSDVDGGVRIARGRRVSLTFRTVVL